MFSKKSVTKARLALFLLLVYCSNPHRALAQGSEIMGSSKGSIFGLSCAAISYDMQGVLPSRSAEPWFPTLYNPPTVEMISEPPQLRPEGIAYRSGLLYVSGDWSETQNQIAVFTVNSWGDLTYDHAIQESLSSPPPTTIPNNEWWGSEGMTFNTGPTGIGAGGATIVSVDNQQQGVGNTLAVINPENGARSGFSVAPYPEDIAYAPVSQRFYLIVRSPNVMQAYDVNMNSLDISWTLPSRSRGAVVVSEGFGRFITGDNTVTGEVILVVSSENVDAIPPLTNRLTAYRLDGTQIGATQDMHWVDLSLDNSSGGGTVPGPHTFQGIAVDEPNKILYIADDSARAVYVVKPFLPITSTASGPVLGQTWTARGMDVKTVLPSRSAEPWFPALSGSVNDPPRTSPEGMTFRSGSLYVSGDWNQTQNQVAVFDAAVAGTLTFNHAIQLPISTPPPDPATPNSELWGPEGLTFNTGTTGYGANASALVTCEDAQFLMFGNTRALLNPLTGALSGFGTFNSVVGAASPDDIAYGPQTGHFYVLADANVLQVWSAADPPAYLDAQFGLIVRSKGLAVISQSFAQFLLNDPSITEEHLLVVAKSRVESTTAPHNRLAVYSQTGSLKGEQDLFWTRDAFPGAPLQEFEAVAVDEPNRVIYIGDEQAEGIFILTLTTSLTISTVSPLPPGVSNQPYSQSIAASGGTVPYMFSLTGGALCAGVSLSAGGVVAGVPTECGVFSFTVTVQDSSVPALTDSKPFVLSVASGGIAGDVSGDGLVNGADVRGFVAAFIDPGSGACGADMNADYVVDQADLPLLIGALTSP